MLGCPQIRERRGHPRIICGARGRVRYTNTVGAGLSRRAIRNDVLSTARSMPTIVVDLPRDVVALEERKVRLLQRRSTGDHDHRITRLTQRALAACRGRPIHVYLNRYRAYLWKAIRRKVVVHLPVACARHEELTARSKRAGGHQVTSSVRMMALTSCGIPDLNLTDSGSWGTGTASVDVRQVACA